MRARAEGRGVGWRVMNDRMVMLMGKMRELEREVVRELQKREREFGYEVREKKVRFSEEARAAQRKLLKRVYRFLRDSRAITMLTAPVIWGCLLPLLLLDLATTVFQKICFPIYGIPKVVRADYIAMDRHHLSYLNGIEKLNCAYCGYANGLLAYITEMAGRTEQFWCPIKHALRLRGMHSRYGHFVDYGDAYRYREKIEEVRRDFADLG